MNNMTKQDLIDRSLTEIDKLKNDTVVGDSELNFYEEFVSKYSPFSIETIKNMNYSDYFKATINISMKDIPFSKIDEDMDKFGELLNKKSVEDIVMLTDVLKTITAGKMDDKINDNISVLLKEDEKLNNFPIIGMKSPESKTVSWTKDREIIVESEKNEE